MGEWEKGRQREGESGRMGEEIRDEGRFSRLKVFASIWMLRGLTGQGDGEHFDFAQ